MNFESIDMDVFHSEPAEQYHAMAGEYLSSHQLIDFIRSPWLYRKKALGLIPNEDTPEMAIGRATHVRILEGKDAFEKEFAVGGPINSKTGKPYGPQTKAFAEWCRAAGKPGVHQDDLGLIEQMAAGVAMNGKAVDLLSIGRAEGVIRACLEGAYCQARFDWVNPGEGIVDLKTAKNLDRFEWDARDYGYINQIAFYQAVLAAALDKSVPMLAPVYIIAVEKREPFRCGVWRIGDDSLAIARDVNAEAIQRLRRAWESDEFPTGYEAVRVLDYRMP
jgi:hypothetical protein